MYLKYSLNGI
jgi:hypothetical protein